METNHFQLVTVRASLELVSLYTHHLAIVDLRSGSPPCVPLCYYFYIVITWLDIWVYLYQVGHFLLG